jgi:hypothetical protein
MVEQATHNRQATGSNPVRAIFPVEVSMNRALLCAVTFFMMAHAALAQAPELRPLPSANPTPPSQTSNPLQPAETAEQQQLHGLAQFQSLAANASAVTITRMPCCKRPIGLRCVRIKVRNNGDLPVTIMGDAATADGNGFKHACAATLMADVRRSGCGLTSGDLALLAAVGVGSLYLAGPIMYELVADPKGGVTSGMAFGRDGIRHKVESVRMTNRLIMPGDETDGALCFDTPGLPTTVRIPVITGQAGTVAGELELPVR